MNNIYDYLKDQPLEIILAFVILLALIWLGFEIRQLNKYREKNGHGK